MTDPEFLITEAQRAFDEAQYHSNQHFAKGCVERAARLRAIAEKYRRMEEALSSMPADENGEPLRINHKYFWHKRGRTYQGMVVLMQLWPHDGTGQTWAPAGVFSSAKACADSLVARAALSEGQ
jgi:hypothetical protein